MIRRGLHGMMHFSCKCFSGCIDLRFQGSPAKTMTMMTMTMMTMTMMTIMMIYIRIFSVSDLCIFSFFPRLIRVKKPFVKIFVYRRETLDLIQAPFLEYKKAKDLHSLGTYLYENYQYFQSINIYRLENSNKKSL